MRFAIFRLHLSKLRDTGSYEVLHLSRKIILANLQIWCSKMQPLSGNQHPDLLTSLWWTCVLYYACHSKCIFADPLQMSHACHRFWTCYKTLTFSSLLWRCTIPCACHANDIWTSKSGPNLVCFVHFDFEMCTPLWREARFEVKMYKTHQVRTVRTTFGNWDVEKVHAVVARSTFSTSQLPKVVRTWCALYILTSKCASRHNGVHFFDISISKSGPNCPNLVRFVHFDFEMCFAPQRRALFRHLNFQKWSEPSVSRAFWLRNVLRATTACTFSTSQLPKVVRTWCVLYILTSKCASRHNGVHFFDISISKSGGTMVCFVHFDFEMCFAPQRRALFRHLNFQKWSENGVFCTFWLRNVLRATTACNCSSLI